MDEIDLVQENASAAQEALMAGIRQKMLLEQSLTPPDYRECRSCGCEIPAARLKLRPNARYCVDCQADLEAGRL